MWSSLNTLFFFLTEWPLISEVVNHQFVVSMIWTFSYSFNYRVKAHSLSAWLQKRPSRLSLRAFALKAMQTDATKTTLKSKVKWLGWLCKPSTFDHVGDCSWLASVDKSATKKPNKKYSNLALDVFLLILLTSHMAQSGTSLRFVTQKRVNTFIRDEVIRESWFFFFFF